MGHPLSFIPSNKQKLLYLLNHCEKVVKLLTLASAQRVRHASNLCVTSYLALMGISFLFIRHRNTQEKQQL